MSTPVMSTPVAERPASGASALFIVGILLVMLGFGPFAGGIVVAAVGGQQDRDGVLSTPAVRLSSADYAITVPDLRVRTDLAVVPESLLGLRLDVRAQNQGDSLFVGMASRADVEEYLDGVAHSELVDRARGRDGMGENGMRDEGVWDDGIRDGFELRDTDGTREPAAPAAQEFWVVSDSGSDRLRIDVPIRDGDWAIVVMNDDASSDVEIAASVGVRSDLIVPAGVTILLIGGALVLGGLALVIFGIAVVAGRSSTSRTAVGEP